MNKLTFIELPSKDGDDYVLRFRGVDGWVRTDERMKKWMEEITKLIIKATKEVK